MSIAFRRVVCLLILGLSLITPALAQSQSLASSVTSSEVKDLAVALVRIKSETEREQLLTEKDELKKAELLIALKSLSDPLVRKGEYNEAIRISQLSVRIAETMEDRVQVGLALYEVGAIHARRVPPKDALNYLEKSLAIFEELGATKEQARALLAIGITYENERRRELAGVPSIVVSQWKVESAGTRDLMVDFHRSLIATKSKTTKTEALRQAALKLMKNSETSHPFYWAGFVLVGDGR